jgi:hypothetical protein
LHYPLLAAGILFSVMFYVRPQSVGADQLAPGLVVFGTVFWCAAPAIYLATVVTFLMWLYTAYVRATAGVEDARFTPAASVGWWFGPFANLWMPFQAMGHLWQLSHSGVDWQRVPPPRRIAVWWLALVSCIGLNCAVVAMVWLPNVVLLRRILGFAAPALAMVAVFFAARILGEITSMQRERLGIE